MDILESAPHPLPKRLKEARTKLGVSQKKLGIMAGIDEFSSSARINQYEKGKHSPDYSMAKRLSNILKTPVSYLYEEDDDIAEMLLLYFGMEAHERKKIMELILIT